MHLRFDLVLTLLLLYVLFAPAAGLAQTYQEMDAEAKAANDWVWSDALLGKVGKRVVEEFDAGNYENAIEEGNRFLAYAPAAYGGVQLNRGRAHLELFRRSGDNKHFARARADFHFAIQQKPGAAQYYIYLGDLYFAAKRGFEADREYSKALAIDPRSLGALNGKAAAAYFARDLQGCVNAIKGVMTHPDYKRDNDPLLTLRMAQCYASLGDKTNAKVNFEKAVSLRPEWKGSWVYMAFAKDGYTCKRAGRGSGPEKPFEKYVYYLRSYNCPDGGGAISSFAIFEQEHPNLRDDGLFHESEFKRKEMGYEYLDSLGIKDVEYLYNDARFWLESARNRNKGRSLPIKDYHEILEVLNHAININVGGSDSEIDNDFGVLARYERAKLLLGQSDKRLKLLAWIEQAILSNLAKEKYVGKPVSANGADVKARVMRGRLYSEVKGNLRAAVAEFDAAIDILKTSYKTPRLSADSPHFAEPYWRKGDLLTQLGDVDKAAEAFVESLSISPINQEAIAGLERLLISPSVSANRGAASKVNDILMGARINEIVAKANKGYADFLARTGSNTTLKQKCSASQTYLGTLTDLRGQLTSRGGSISHGTKLREHHTNAVSSIDNAIRLIRNGLGAC